MNGLSLYDEPQLPDLTGLDTLGEVTTYLDLSQLPSFLHPTGVEHLHTTLPDLDGLRGLAPDAVNLHLEGLPALRTLDALSQVENVEDTRAPP